MMFKTILMSAAALGAVAMPADAIAASVFDLESLPQQQSANGESISVSDGSLTMTISQSNGGSVGIFDTSVALLGDRAVIGFLPSGGFGGLTFEFSSLINSITFAYGDGGGDDDSPVIFEAFDSMGTSLGSATAQYPAGASQGGTITLDFAGASYFTYRSGLFSNPNSLFIDVVSLTAAVPEPATWAMFLLGFGAVGYSMRRRKGTTAQMSFA